MASTVGGCCVLGVKCLDLSTAYIEMQDLLRDFEKPAVMDIKMGTR